MQEEPLVPSEHETDDTIITGKAVMWPRCEARCSYDVLLLAAIFNELQRLPFCVGTRRPVLWIAIHKRG